MPYNFDSAIAELAAAAKTLEADAKAAAIEDMQQDADAMKAFCVENFGVDLAGFPYESNKPNLTVYIYDKETIETYVTFDPIQGLFNEFPDPFAADAVNRYGDAISALEDGIARIRAYQESKA